MKGKPVRGIVYILHFDEPLSHARHYAGCTCNLLSRLTTHANGGGSNLCRVLRDNNIQWRLGGAYLTNSANMRRIERAVKNCNHLQRYCRICTPLGANRPEGTVPIDVGCFRYPTTSTALDRKESLKTFNAQVIDSLTIPHSMDIIKEIWRDDKDALGYIPIGGKEGLEYLHQAGRLLVCREEDTITGYIAFTVNRDSTEVKIQQCVTGDMFRLRGYGRQMVEEIEKRYPGLRLRANVREDLAANFFWHSIGFDHALSFHHKTSGSLINTYYKGEL